MDVQLELLAFVDKAIAGSLVALCRLQAAKQLNSSDVKALLLVSGPARSLKQHKVANALQELPAPCLKQQYCQKLRSRMQQGMRSLSITGRPGWCVYRSRAVRRIFLFALCVPVLYLLCVATSAVQLIAV
jgi:hypothetical protein